MKVQRCDIRKFYAFGVNYKKADSAVRGLFSLSPERKEAFLVELRERGIEGFAISTCNRTEVFAMYEDIDEVVDLYCDHVTGSKEMFYENAFIYHGEEGVDHLFRVAAGLDSQILGDFEIVSQLKNDFELAKTHGTTSTFFERLYNNALQCSKRVKNETTISSGAASVAYAAVSYIRQQMVATNKRKVLLFGTGKIGMNTCTNLVKHVDPTDVTVINRTFAKAEQVAIKNGVNCRPIEELKEAIAETDFLVVATNGATPTVTTENLAAEKEITVLDLSIPQNICSSFDAHDNKDILHVDELSKISDQTLAERRAQIPQAEVIIAQEKDVFREWLRTRQYASVLSAFNEKLTSMHKGEMNYQSKKISDFNEEQADIVGARMIQKITTQLASYLRKNKDDVESVELIERIFDLA